MPLRPLATHDNFIAMPNFFRTHDGRARKASNLLPLTLPDGAIIEDVWAGSAMEEKLSWWLSRSGHQLTQSEEISKIASKADDNGEIIWGATPAGGRLFFVLLPPPTGKTYRLAKLVTTSATLAQAAYFRHERAALFGHLKPDGRIEKILPLVPPPPTPKAQGELFSPA